MKKSIFFLMIVVLVATSVPLTVFAQDPDPPEAESYGELLVDGLIEESEVTVVDGLLSSNTLGTPSSSATGLGVYPVSVEERRINGRLVIVKTFEVDSTYNPEYLVEPDFEQNGYLYRKSEILKNDLDPIEETKKTYETVTVRTDSKDEAELVTLLSPLLDFSEGGYTGQLELDYSSINTVVEGTQSYAYTVRESREFAGLDRNDAAYIPKTLSLNGQTLHLNDIEWTSMGGAVRGDVILPSSYTATAYYDGTGYGSNATGYISTAVYKGEVTRLLPGPVQYFVIYEGFELPVEKEVNVMFWVSLFIHIATLSALGWLLWRQFGRHIPEQVIDDGGEY